MKHPALRKYYYGGGVSYSTEYQAVLDRATALGYTQPSGAQKTKQNTLVTSLKDAGIWSLLDVFYVFANDGGGDFATLNWKAPSSYQITRVNTPTFTSNQGFNGNGTTQYINTGWVPSTNGVNYTLNSASAGCHIYAHVTEAKVDFGTCPSGIGSTPTLFFRADEGFGSSVYSVNQAPNATFSNGGNCAGFHMSQRKDSANVYHFKNGSQVDTEADASTAVPSGAIYLLANNNSGSAATFSTRKMSCFFAGASLSGLESSFYTSWNTYLSSL